MAGRSVRGTDGSSVTVQKTKGQKDSFDIIAVHWDGSNGTGARSRMNHAQLARLYSHIGSLLGIAPRTPR